MADSQVMTCQPLRQSCSKFKIDFSDLFDEDDDRPPPPCPGLRSAEESSRIWKRRREGWAKDFLEKKKNDDDDPEPSNSRTAIFRVRVPANANPNQDTSALTTYLGDQAGNTNMVEDILVGRSGAGGEKNNLYMKNDDLQTDFLPRIDMVECPRQYLPSPPQPRLSAGPRHRSSCTGSSSPRQLHFSPPRYPPPCWCCPPGCPGMLWKLRYLDLDLHWLEHRLGGCLFCYLRGLDHRHRSSPGYPLPSPARGLNHRHRSLPGYP